MSLTEKDVHRIATLARLQVPEAEVAATASSLSNILDLIAQMDTVDTDNIEPLAHPFESTQRLREDKVTESDQREAFFALAPSSEAMLFLVPQVIE